MSNSNFYGRIDRRKPVPEPKQIQIKDRFEQIYQEMGQIRYSRLKEMEKQSLETDAFLSAFAKTNGKDKDALNSYKVQLMQLCGRNFGEGAANQVLARIGVFLLEAERKGQL